MQLRHPNRPRGLNFVPAKLDQIDQAMPPNIRIWLFDSKHIHLGVSKLFGKCIPTSGVSSGLES